MTATLAPGHIGRFQYEWHDEAGQWWRSYGNEQWEFAPDGLMARREASINDVPIAAEAAAHPRSPDGRGRDRTSAVVTSRAPRGADRSATRGRVA